MALSIHAAIHAARHKYAARRLRAVYVLSGLSTLAALTLAFDIFAATPTPTPTPPAAPNTLVTPAKPVQAAQPARPANVAAQSATKSDTKPLWTELTPLQQQVLGPLASEWNKLDSNHKVKWIAISNKYPSMNPEQQKRLQENIRDWAKMTPEQHRLAREGYTRAKQLDTVQKAIQWAQYQQLSEEQKQKLAADDATSKKHVANIPALRTKSKSVEPLKSSKKTSVAHTATPTEHPAATAPAGTVPVAPTSAVPASAPSPAPATQVTIPASLQSSAPMNTSPNTP